MVRRRRWLCCRLAIPPEQVTPGLAAGIVQGKGVVRNVDRKTDFCVFDIELPAERAENVAIGASVAINGTCLTVVQQQGTTLRFDVMVETLRRTNLGALQPGTGVNFERSARVGDEIGGHTVSGHVHTTATIARVQDSENNRRVEYQVGGCCWECADMHEPGRVLPVRLPPVLPEPPPAAGWPACLVRPPTTSSWPLGDGLSLCHVYCRYPTRHS